MHEQLKQYEVKLNEIMVPENLAAIICLLNSLRSHNEYRVLDNEFNTIVANAKLDGQDDLIRAVVQYVGEKNNVQ